MDMKDKLNLLFDELDCTDADIATRAGIHPSGISRFRTGKRMPTPRSSQLMGICEGIAVYSDEQGTTSRLRELCDADERDSTESLPGRLFAWLFEGSLIYPEKRSNKEDHFLDESRGKFF
ncbi:helix-turn-helix domain-containing protein, partial [Christensenellaceae bacterium OttesenSCG-928-K19]|nr:helix-turn-helix domain-containing protein [Christensenellaceae bacterium OttesenSCG-928-K19]